MEPKILRLGSIYFNDNPVEVGAIYKNEALSLGDTVPGRELQWVDDGGYLIADRCICVNISQKQVLEHGFLLGIPVRIDSRSYLCRCLKVSDKPQRPNEWDDLLLKYGDADDLWHWKDQYFIGQESCLNAQNFCTVRGGNIANDWNTFGNGYRAETIGFRPLLKPLPPSPILDNSVIGKWVKVYGPQRISFGGKLVAFDDYDIVLMNALPLPTDCRLAYKDEEVTVVQRSAVTWIREDESPQA